MQTKKEEIRNDIIKAATREFLYKGYNKSSLRTIAKKANTTIGNVYNYFENKEAILDCIVEGVPEKVSNIINIHNNFKVDESILTRENSKEYMDMLFEELFPLDILLNDAFVILLEGCEGTKFEKYKQEFTKLFSNHVADHLKVDKGSFLPKAFSQGAISAFVMIVKNKKSFEEKKHDLREYILTMALGLPVIKNNVL